MKRLLIAGCAQQTVEQTGTRTVFWARQAFATFVTELLLDQPTVTGAPDSSPCGRLGTLRNISGRTGRMNEKR